MRDVDGGERSQKLKMRTNKDDHDVDEEGERGRVRGG